MNLTIDIGNTRSKLGLFKDHQLVEQSFWTSYSVEDIISHATNHQVKNIILSTVGKPIEPSWEAKLANHFYYLQLDHQTPLPIKNAYGTPTTLGKDRLAAIVGAWQLYPGENCLVIDAGTCITYDLLDAEGTYRGGNISPGLAMRFRAMHEFTARLPLVASGEIDNAIGQSTETAMRNGGQLGTVLELEGFIRLFSSQFGELRVILTGGDAEFFAKVLKSKIFVNPDLVLRGLNKILTYNAEQLV
ncbi:type III pantothenate kinase [Flavilitoribacter nigricans]|uniref:Type III pantothenate kinase n=1 Tax=Flavilitoribacter nigricans (strain ATCC 23147 / DSM 23189 / NBRC 102662 / NCIMB 1420 / SS-2) TaxID=1122177 RepID=A0A2D0NAZ1_FLAN2|nr:type III pantothenate kinase [Flavilitoribacter nigricans]PHN05681.1 pantothenate kinase [Flavilitoribacter nigricans DSM 23189 = NBRC 102662]